MRRASASAWEARTRVVNPYGCMVVLAQSLELEHRLALTNLISEASNAAIVVWKGNQRPDGWEYGIELVAPEMDFLGAGSVKPSTVCQARRRWLE